MLLMEFPRLSELQEHGDPAPPEFYSFDAKDNRIAQKQFRDIEADLQGLDPHSWAFLKAELVPLLKRRDGRRGWQALLDKLNEAKGHNYLTSIACSGVRFIPRSLVHGQKTPDLAGWLGSTSVLCEVKTINVSDDECNLRKGGGVGTISARLRPEFFSKLKSTLEGARNQLAAYGPSPDVRKIAYVVVNYDDILHEYSSNYKEQLQTFLATHALPEVEVIFDSKPPFYWATA
jgi:hypothetical protein